MVSDTLLLLLSSSTILFAVKGNTVDSGVGWSGDKFSDMGTSGSLVVRFFNVFKGNTVDSGVDWSGDKFSDVDTSGSLLLRFFNVFCATVSANSSARSVMPLA